MFVLRGKSSMAMRLSDMGYDVWLGNARGNFYTSSIDGESRFNKSYWDFTLDDMAIYDLPPVFELIANVTKKPGELIYVGHSASTTEAMIYSIRMKEHAENHIKAFILLGPVAYIDNNLFMRVIRTLVKLRYNTLAARSKLPTKFCSMKGFTWNICIFTLNLFIGSDRKNFPPEEMPLLLSGADIESLKPLNQFAKMAITNRFEAYKSNDQLKSEIYNLGDIKIPTYLIVGKNDLLATYNNAVRMFSELGSTHKKLYAIDNYNHMNYFYAKDLNVSFNPHFDDALDRIGKL